MRRYDRYVRYHLPLLVLLPFLPACAQLPEGSPEECEVHHSPMRAERVPIEYGLIFFTPWEVGSAEDIRAGGRGFPHANEWTTGGCSVDPGRSPTSEIAAYCRECRRDYHRWLGRIGGAQNINYDTPELKAKRAAALEAGRRAFEAMQAERQRMPGQGGGEVANPAPPR